LESGSKLHINLIKAFFKAYPHLAASLNIHWLSKIIDQNPSQILELTKALLQANPAIARTEKPVYLKALFEKTQDTNTRHQILVSFLRHGLPIYANFSFIDTKFPFRHIEWESILSLKDSPYFNAMVIAAAKAAIDTLEPSKKLDEKYYFKLEQVQKHPKIMLALISDGDVRSRLSNGFVARAEQIKRD